MAEAESGKTVFVVNPASAAGATLRRFERIRPRLGRDLRDFDVQLTRGPGHATELVRAALADGATTIVSVGGDGTNNEVVNGFFDTNGAPLGAKAALAVMVSGTGGDFRRTFGWGTEPEETLARLQRAGRRTIDVGRAELTGHDGATVTRHFINIASFGLSGLTDEVVNNTPKTFGAKASFISGTLRAFLRFKPQRVEMQIDDGAPFTEEISLVTAANGQYFGGGMWIAPDAAVDDGALDFVRVQGVGKRFWLQNAAKVYSGKHTRLDAVKSARGRVLTARPLDERERVLIDLDGEQPGRLPARFEVVPGALQLVCDR